MNTEFVGFIPQSLLQFKAECKYVENGISKLTMDMATGLNIIIIISDQEKSKMH